MSEPNRSISRSDYLKLCGIKALADQRNRFMQDLIPTAAEIVGVDVESGEADHVQDLVWDLFTSVDEMLGKLGIAVI